MDRLLSAERRDLTGDFRTRLRFRRVVVPTAAGDGGATGSGFELRDRAKITSHSGWSDLGFDRVVPFREHFV